MGLASLKQKVERGDLDLLDRVTALQNLKVKGIADLRHYSGELKTGEAIRNSLLSPVVHRSAAGSTKAASIEVIDEAPDDFRIQALGVLRREARVSFTLDY